ncbi:MAG TPA: TAXI family TRAP transporter solute-binding subunit, partial [Geminicoccaceae bacterium]|nr:TAXI family TRAP transporter solute-binding subunit [Geminicoccaceae bacterium]
MWGLLVIASCVFGLGFGAAQAAPMNIVTGGPNGTYIQIGRDIGELAAEFDLEVEVHPSAGSMENVEAVYKRPNMQLGVVQSDVLDFIDAFSDDAELRRVADKIKMVFPLYNEEVHALAREGIDSLADLNGKRLVLGPENSGTFLTATYLLAAANVWPGEELFLSPEESVQAMREGRADAMFYVAGQPAKLFAEEVTAEDGFHLLPITDPGVLDFYPASTIPAGAYPWQPQEVPTVAIKAVLMTYDWTPANAYMRNACANVGKLARIINDNVDWLRQEGNGHPKWRQVELDFKLVNWDRSPCVERALSETAGYSLVREEVAADAC